jgi:protein phosphatase
MGATIDAALFVAGRAHLAHVGDGCIYRCRQGVLERLTTAHTLANEHRRAKPDITEAELAGLPKHVLVRALGMGPEVEVDRSEADTQPGDIWLLCTDALTARLSDEAIGVILARAGSASALTRAVLDAGSAASRELADDLTVVTHVVGA